MYVYAEGKGISEVKKQRLVNVYYRVERMCLLLHSRVLKRIWDMQYKNKVEIYITTRVEKNHMYNMYAKERNNISKRMK